MQSRLKMSENKLSTMSDAQTEAAYEMEYLRTQTTNERSESVEVESAAKESDRLAKRAKVV